MKTPFTARSPDGREFAIRVTSRPVVVYSTTFQRPFEAARHYEFRAADDTPVSPMMAKGVRQVGWYVLHAESGDVPLSSDDPKAT